MKEKKEAGRQEKFPKGGTKEAKDNKERLGVDSDRFDAEKEMRDTMSLFGGQLDDVSCGPEKKSSKRGS